MAVNRRQYDAIDFAEDDTAAAARRACVRKRGGRPVGASLSSGLPTGGVRTGGVRTGGLLLAALLFGGLGCSDDVQPSPTTGSSVSANSSSSSSGAGGSGNCNMGAVMGSFDEVHGCTVESAEDHRCESSFTIDGGYLDEKFQYRPKCLLVSKGTTVTINNADNTDFQIHPLQGGVMGQPMDPDSPFGFLVDADIKSADFDLNESGSFPYVCVAHAGSGMIGVVYVE